MMLPAGREIERKYGFRGIYFYLPNQFWVHKNHWVVLKAVASLKARGVEIGHLHRKLERLPDQGYRVH